MASVLVAGFGFMGRTHAGVLRDLQGATVAGVVDSRGESIAAAAREVAGEDVPVFTDLGEALAACSCDAVDICLPTDCHREAAERAFADGKHVFCEKPIALTLSDARAMIAAAGAAGRQLMVGQCIRFWPEYESLKDAVDSGKFGKLLSLSLSRRTGRPDYAVDGWVNDPARCVGAALDLHIHDTDYVCHLLGAPRAVSSRGVLEPTGWNSIASIYDFGPEGPLVFADGAWNYPAGWGFQMRFSAVFESAALDFDSRADPTLSLATTGGPSTTVHLPEPATDGYRRELEYFVGCIERACPVQISSGEQAARSLEATLAEIESASRGGEPVLLPT